MWIFGIMIILGYLTNPTRPECCGFIVANCEAGGAAGWGPCCSHGGLGSCNVFCCNCDNECIARGCGYSLVNLSFRNESRMEEVQVSEKIACTDTEPCRLSVEINRVFEASTQRGDLRTPVRSLVDAEFSDSYKDAVAERTMLGETVECEVNPGHEVWLGQEPRFAVLSGSYVYTCCDGGVCWEDKEKSGIVHHQMPIVRANGIMDSKVFCHEEPLEGFVRSVDEIYSTPTESNDII